MQKSIFRGVFTHSDSFYDLLKDFVLSRHLRIDASRYAQAGLNYTMKYFFLKKNFSKNDHPEYFINKCFERFNLDVAKETIL